VLLSVIVVGMIIEQISTFKYLGYEEWKQQKCDFRDGLYVWLHTFRLEMK